MFSRTLENINPANIKFEITVALQNALDTSYDVPGNLKTKIETVIFNGVI